MRICCYTALSAVLMVAACTSKDTAYVHDHEAMDRWSVQVYQQQMVEQGILAEHTLYPHHFTANTDALNDLGSRDLGVIARHYQEHPGALNVRRTNTPEDLYQARVETVRQRLADAGVDVARIQIDDLFPGGDGMSAERVLFIREADHARLLTEPAQYQESAATTGVTR